MFEFFELSKENHKLKRKIERLEWTICQQGSTVDMLHKNQKYLLEENQKLRNEVETWKAQALSNPANYIIVSQERMEEIRRDKRFYEEGKW